MAEHSPTHWEFRVRRGCWTQRQEFSEVIRKVIPSNPTDSLVTASDVSDHTEPEASDPYYSGRIVTGKFWGSLVFPNNAMDEARWRIKWLERIFFGE
ncbi:hypothetical protein Q31a_16960 [Aureliella helgolandensis]|uniref:Uncharacterized protein n=1 Tax=Aureliella helgolandensis TaxID=2527968 RepID=A0A518G476_9BACT|nr:hypothetical protein Q31a_16960 [Aureliella helgolandensis]